MKKIILSLFVLLSLSSFTQEKYQVEVEPAVKLNQSILLDYNSQIEKEVSRIYSKEEMFGMMNKMMNGFSATSDIKNDKNHIESLKIDTDVIKFLKNKNQKNLIIFKFI